MSHHNYKPNFIMSTILAKIDHSKYKTILHAGNHILISDEPEPIGRNLGPTPYEYLLFAIGSCVAMTLRMYADRKGWAMDEVEVHLSQSRIHAEDCHDCESENGFVHVISKRIKFKGQLKAHQIDRLLEIADKCPVNKTLMNEIKMETGSLI